MEFQLPQAIEVLRNTPATIRGLLADVSEPWVRNNYGEKTFSPFDVVGHLIHGERADWMPRTRIILEHGESRPFDPFDRYAMYEASRGKSIGALLDEFESLRAGNLRDLEALELTCEQLDLCGTHPELGRVTLRNMLATWVVHDLNHIHQIAKSMAYQYRAQVGPWQAYIPFLPRN